MPVVRMFSGTYCHAAEICTKVVEALGYDLVDDSHVVKDVAERFDIPESRIARTLTGKVSAFNSFTHERERVTGCLKLAIADLLANDAFVLSGLSSQLVPSSISHVLGVCIIATMESRCALAIKRHGVSEKEAQRLVRKDDEVRALWTDYILGKSPWDSDIYDVFIPTDRVGVDEAVELIVQSARSEAVVPNEASRQAVRDFALATRVEVALGKAGHDVTVHAQAGSVTLTINKHALMLSRLEADLKAAAAEVEGVRDVETKVGPGFYQAGIYRQFDPELPSKVLLVDDEREFVQTLSERLQMRDVGAAVVYGGEQALSFVREEEPDVIVLDLKMPGIDGIEVLRKVKHDHPGIEVIVLTGHGSEKDEETCMRLGAFAYLRKPVDIEHLSRTMREAYRRIRTRPKETES